MTAFRAAASDPAAHQPSPPDRAAPDPGAAPRPAAGPSSGTTYPSGAHPTAGHSGHTYGSASAHPGAPRYAGGAPQRGPAGGSAPAYPRGSQYSGEPRIPRQHGAPGQNGRAAWAAPDPAASEGPTQPLGTPEPPAPGSAAANEQTARPEAAPEDAKPVKEPKVPAKEPRTKVRKAPRRTTVALAVLLSLLALAGSVAAVVLAWRTKESEEARRTEESTAVETPSPAPARPDEYRVSYAKEPLRIQPACAAVVHLDLDEPRAAVAENLADLRYENRCGGRQPQLSLGAGAARGSRYAGADTDAEGCDRAIRTSPLGQGLRVEVTKGTALCVLTTATPAALVLVEIVEVGGSGGAGLRATSWQMPGGR
ncbi:hypothetical protein [Actinoplanes flavus]|uniref:Serine/threonine protein kinase n=1 Tax=Actinoplanes flavus TaxID=2820290 RepID=A0ABS3URN2_9ACTN|nr:hypothetical protein [Actinoplanes flavus]MBO3741061.1 hypothetical protein [Actinoplanes flavus]